MSLVDQIDNQTQNGEPSPLLEGTDKRSSEIVRTSVIGIIGNTALVVIKFVIGAITNSVAIMSDAINNLADTIGSVLIIVGIKLSRRKPDRKHPYGYGRTEYIVTIIMGAIIIFAGTSALHGAVNGIITPKEATYTILGLVVLAFAAAGRLALGIYYKRRGAALKSDSLIASGTDSVLDALITAAAILSAIIFMTTGVSTEAYLALAISLVILKAGLEVLLKAISQILGQRVNPTTAARTKDTIESIPGVLKACDLRLLDYGPEDIRGCTYIEVDERLSVTEADRIAQAVQLTTFMELGVQLDAVGVQPVSCSTEEILQMRKHLEQMALKHKHVLDMHGFRVRENTGVVAYSIVVDYEIKNRERFSELIAQEAEREYPNHRFLVTTVPDIAG